MRTDLRVSDGDEDICLQSVMVNGAERTTSSADNVRQVLVLIYQVPLGANLLSRLVRFPFQYNFPSTVTPAGESDPRDPDAGDYGYSVPERCGRIRPGTFLLHIQR